MKNKKTGVNYWDFLVVMTSKELRSRYRRTEFGFWWMIINPLVQMAVLGVIFSAFVKVDNYFLFIFSGLVIWQFFSVSLSKATSSFVNNISLIKKAVFPREIIPVSIVLANFIQLLVAEAILIVFLTLTGLSSFGSLLWILPALVWLLVVTLGISLLLSSLNVRYRDINFFTQALLVIWFYATPILYPVSLLPPGLEWVLNLNPLSSIVEMGHLAFLGSGELDLVRATFNLVVGGVLLTGGVVIFNKFKNMFVDWY